MSMLWPTLGSRTAKEQNRTLISTPFSLPKRHASLPGLIVGLQIWSDCGNVVMAIKWAFKTLKITGMLKHDMSFAVCLFPVANCTLIAKNRV